MKLRHLFRVAVFLFLMPLLCVAAHGTAPGYLVQIRQDIALFSETQPEFGRPIHEETGLYYVEDFSMLQELEDAGLVTAWYPNGMVYLHEDKTKTDPAYLTWVRSMLGYDYAADQGITGKGIRIAIIDSGLSTSFHEHTSAVIETGTNYLKAPNDTDRHNTEDVKGHGTHVASVIADNAVGLAPEVTLIPLKCFADDGSATYDSILKAIHDAVDDIYDEKGQIIDEDEDGMPDNYGCDILNLSFGGNQYYKPLDDAIQYARSKGVIVVASAGNRSPSLDVHFYPAALHGVISVGSVNNQKQIARTSAQNNGVFLTAPGVGIYGWSVKTNAYDTDSGTSFAAPAVTAAAALALSVEPTLTAGQLQNYLLQSVEDLGLEGYDKTYGYGLLNVERLLKSIQETDSPDPSGSTSVAVHHAPIGVNTFTACMAIYNSAGKLWELRQVATTNGFALFRDLPLPTGGYYRIFTVNDSFTPLFAANNGLLP